MDVMQIMNEHGVKPTSNRTLVAKALEAADRPLSLTELDAQIESVDKSGIFRALALFRETHMVHVIEDGSNCARYELCRSQHHDADHDEDSHLHFYCESCHRSFCLTDVPVPTVVLPDGYSPSSINFIVKGICPECSKH